MTKEGTKLATEVGSYKAELRNACYRAEVPLKM
jgi:hypothetical protein